MPQDSDSPIWLTFATEGNMGSHGWKFTLLGFVSIAAAEMSPQLVHAQGTRGPSSSDSRVGYIDPAIPGDLVRLRYDAAFNNRRPARAEIFWPRGGPFGPGPPIPENSVDYQDLSTYLEATLTPQVSGFVEFPARFLNPNLNANTSGYGDMNAGFKYAFIYEDDLVATLQFRTYIPTGDADRGLGNNHVSLEPALLIYRPLSERCGLEAELRDWIPIGGTDFAGNIIRYGVGLHYDLICSCHWQLSPVAELVGWTVLDGKESARHPSGLVEVQDAAGDTIVNVKLGVRLKLGDIGDIYTGYGRPLTGERWYENIYRLELRLFY